MVYKHPGFLKSRSKVRVKLLEAILLHTLRFRATVLSDSPFALPLTSTQSSDPSESPAASQLTASSPHPGSCLPTSVCPQRLSALFCTQLLSQSLQVLLSPLHTSAPSLQPPLIIFKYKFLCFTLSTFPILTCSYTPPSSSINLLAQPSTPAWLIYLLSSTYFMFACLYLFAVSPPSLHLIMHKSQFPLGMCG